MEILPAWLIIELEKLEELKRQQERHRLYIELPYPLPPRHHSADNSDEPEETPIVISLR